MSQLVEHCLALRIDPQKFESAFEYDHHIRDNVLKFLDKIPQGKLATHGDKTASDPLAALEPEKDTLPYLYFLNGQVQVACLKAKQSNPITPGSNLWNKVSFFFDNCDPVQLRYGGNTLKSLIGHLCDRPQLQENEQTSSLSLAAKAILRLDESGGTFTSNHLLLIQKCLEIKSFHEATKILNCDIHSLPKKGLPEDVYLCSDFYENQGYITVKSKLTSSVSRTDVQEYFILGGMVYIALKDWNKALHFFEHVLSTPTTQHPNWSMLEAYRKWILVSLMAHGKVESLPKTANNSAIKSIKAGSKHYETLSDAFSSVDSLKLAAEAFEAQELFSEDGNAGLVQAVLGQHRKLSVSRLAKTYAAVPVRRIASQLRMSEQETFDYLESLIQDGFLQASMDQSKPGQTVLRFAEMNTWGRTGRTEEELRNDILAKTQKLKLLTRQVQEADRRLGMTKEYMEHTTRDRRDRENLSTEGNHEDPMDISIGGPIPSEDDEDENMMTDRG